MIIEIELLIIILLILEFIIWFAWYKISTKLIVRRYKKENDKGYIGEENRKKLIRESEEGTDGRESDTPTTTSDIPGTRESEERGNLQIPTSIDDGQTSSNDGETSDSNRKVSRKFRNPFKRRGERR